MRAVVIVMVVAVTIGFPVEGVVRAQGMRQPAAAVSKPPFPLDDPDAIAEGGRRFSASCTGYCHGREGRVARAPKLRGKTYDPYFVYARIENGFQGGQVGPMPAFRTMLAPDEIWKIVAYIMSLSSRPDD
ncbi:MAG: cytochrome c [Candidatus Rokuibacteriota bacterium]|nr:MAG: cytochrome c [Candidatus Rokubacteria bacterium]